LSFTLLLLVAEALMEQAGMTAAVPTKARKQLPDDLSFVPDASVDAVVSLATLGQLDPSQRSKCLSEIQRVLKPGRPLIFVERLQEGGSPLRGLIGGSNGALGVQEVESWGQLKGLEGLQWDIALGGQDPHAAGVAFRKEGYVVPRSQREEAGRQKMKQPKPQKTAKGFS
jgi:predicted methyltransferase